SFVLGRERAPRFVGGTSSSHLARDGSPLTLSARARARCSQKALLVLFAGVASSYFLFERMLSASAMFARVSLSSARARPLLAASMSDKTLPGTADTRYRYLVGSSSCGDLFDFEGRTTSSE